MFPWLVVLGRNDFLKDNKYPYEVWFVVFDSENMDIYKSLLKPGQ